jgi:hypothetical protein
MLARRGYWVLVADSAAAAARFPHCFHCAVFGVPLPDTSAIALAGWLLIGHRISSAVFFGDIQEVDLRLRASNVGTFVGRDEGLRRLEVAVHEAILEKHAARFALGGEVFCSRSGIDCRARRGAVT